MARNKALFGIFCALLIQPALSQVNRYMIFFADKEGSAFSQDQPEAFLSARAIQRHVHHGYSVTVEDLPVNASYLQQLENTGAAVYFTSRWMNAALVEADESLIAQLEQLDFVSEVEYVAPGSKLNGRVGKSPAPADGVDLKMAASTVQNQMIDVTEMHAQGFRGEGMLIAVFDGGFAGVDQIDAFGHLYDNDQVKGTVNYLNKDDQVYQFSEHGTQVFSIMAANDSVQIVGTAPESDYFLMVTEDPASEYRIEEYNWLFAAEFADSAGVDLINSSLSYFTFDDPTMDYSYAEDMDGQTTVAARAANMASDRGILVVSSMGNEGDRSWKYVTTPGDAPNILAVGAVNSLNELASFSSIGPSADQRIKPDLVALGQGTTTLKASGTVFLGSGTSFATPLVTGLAAGLWQANPNMTNLEIIERLRRSGDNAMNPDNMRGYGLPSFSEAQEVVGIEDEVPVFDMKVYPNPTFSKITIDLQPDNSLQNFEARLYTANGQLLLSRNSGNQPVLELDLTIFPGGVYILSISTADRTHRVKVIKN